MSAEIDGFAANFVHMYMAEITSNIIAESGIPTDRFHLGKILLKNLRDDPDFVMQIDGSSGKSETNGEVLRRCIQCASALTQLGVRRGDVVVLAAPNHLDLVVPFYASMFLGISIAPVDRMLGVYELKDAFGILEPKVIFCQSSKVSDCKTASTLLKLDSKIISFDESAEAMSFAEFMAQADDIDVQNFKATDLDPNDTTALLIPTSGTTGLPKFCITTHRNVVTALPYVLGNCKDFPTPIKSSLVVSPLQWLSAIANYVLGVFLKYTRIQSPLEMTSEHTIDIIKKYKPSFLIISPTMMTTLVKAAPALDCDFSNLDLLFLGGSAVPPELVTEMQRLSPRTLIADVYGMTEICGLALCGLGCPLGSSGKQVGFLRYKLVNIETGADIKEPNKPGELWLKNIAGFKGYFKNAKATADALSEDGWIRTGDMMYRDENWNYFFVDRIKLLLKYRNHQISPLEIESVIREHRGVLDVAVSAVPHGEHGELPVACVVPRPGARLTAEEIQHLVKERLTDTKQLRGGVIFLEELPLTSSTKLHRRKLKEIVINHYKLSDNQLSAA